MNCFHCKKILTANACNCSAKQEMKNKIMASIESEAMLEDTARKDGNDQTISKA